MDYLKSLIIGWSIVWATCLLSLSNIKGERAALLAYVIFPKSGLVSIQSLIIWAAPIYSFGIWAIGCGAIYLSCWFVFKQPNNKQPIKNQSEPEKHKEMDPKVKESLKKYEEMDPKVKELLKKYGDPKVKEILKKNGKQKR
jgi:hypothetical protein